MSPTILKAGALAIALAASSCAHADIKYRVSAIADSADISWNRINNNGLIAGQFNYARAILVQNGQMTQPIDYISTIDALNDHGNYGGTYNIDLMNSSSTGYFAQGGQYTSIPSYATTWRSDYGGVSAINNNNQVVGTVAGRQVRFDAEHPYYAPRAYLWENGQMRSLGNLGIDETEAYDINRYGVVVGRAAVGDMKNAAFLYARNGMQSLASYLPTGISSSATGINDAGQILGQLYSSGDEHAFLIANGETFLFDIDGFRNTKAVGINNAGQFILNGNNGWSGKAAAYVRLNGELFDLNQITGLDSGWSIRESYDINDKGQILVQACTASFDCRSMLLDPLSAPVLLPGIPPAVPEPATCGMLLAGLGIACMLARRQRHASQI
ncbi:PEP-CTERM sorting domain-containing protein [Massilia sp. NR 4-1]|uniref:PEP-CTERM sorting domain-containing protein n=1 Tax=Massilia sp. NR 4-1 TaxID=1678028 RepID=UPI00067C194D|nr:PEP-CTERM sorting domain-containing protein [Massilia sp. NR 4-1]AKU20236.1 hypothetical protein ACZ75_00530 [Massilia sp. NR 4-1]